VRLSDAAVFRGVIAPEAAHDFRLALLGGRELLVALVWLLF
jgi:hypothetical protein